MATYLELGSIRSHPDWPFLLSKIRTAIIIKAATVISDSAPTPEALAWAKEALEKPSVYDEIANFVIAANASATLDNILNAPDTAIQSNIDAAVDKLYG